MRFLDGCVRQVQVAVLVHGYENFYYYMAMLEKMLEVYKVRGKETLVLREQFWAMPPEQQQRFLITFFLDTGCQFSAFWKKCEVLAARLRSGGLQPIALLAAAGVLRAAQRLTSKLRQATGTRHLTRRCGSPLRLHRGCKLCL